MTWRGVLGRRARRAAGSDLAKAKACYVRQRALAFAHPNWSLHLEMALRPLAAELAEVEQLIARSCADANPAVREASEHICRASGKALRPAMTLWTSRVGPTPRPESAIRIAAAVELMHVATLHHDDVIDDAATRRGLSSVNAQWGNLVAILSGDFLLAAAITIAAEVDTTVTNDDPEGYRLTTSVSRTFTALVDGQVSELDRLFDPGRTEAEYLRCIQGKTGAVFAFAAVAGGIVSATPFETCGKLADFGMNFGVGFQIADDLLDVAASPEEIGKPACNDVRQGVYTLPVIKAVARAPELADLLRQQRPDVLRVRELVFDTGAYADAVADAERWFDRAASAVADLDAEPTGALVEMAAAVLQRVCEVPDGSGAAVRATAARNGAGELSGAATTGHLATSR